MTRDAIAAAVTRGGLPAEWFEQNEDGQIPDPPCRIEPRLWDTGRTGIEDIRLAARECVTLCALVDACRARRDELAATGRRSDGTVPELGGMVWAGHAYSPRGTRLDLDNPATRTGFRTDTDTRHVTADGRVFDGHTGTWVPAPEHLTRPTRNRRTR